jgi:hypothetical protein
MRSEEWKGYWILMTMFEISKTTTRRSDRECFNQVVRFLADCARIHPMPKEDHPVADRLMPLAKACLPPGTMSLTITFVRRRTIAQLEWGSTSRWSGVNG